MPLLQGGRNWFDSNTAYGLKMIELLSLSTHSCEYKILALLNGMQVGEVSYTLFVFDTKTAVVTDLEVSSKWRKRGVGTELLHAAVEDIFKRSYIKRILLQDGSSSGVTSRIAQKQGFQVLTKDSPPWWELQRRG